MKRIIKTYFKLFIFLFGISLLLVNCEKDGEIISEYSDISNSRLNVRRVTLEEIRQKQSLRKTIETISKSFDINKPEGSTSSKIDANDESFTILTNEIIEVTTDSTTTYTFRIETPTSSSSTFENFVIDQPNDSLIKYYIYKYQYDETSEEHFPYTITCTEVNDDLIDDSFFGKTEVYLVCDWNETYLDGVLISVELISCWLSGGGGTGGGDDDTGGDDLDDPYGDDDWSNGDDIDNSGGGGTSTGNPENTEGGTSPTGVLNNYEQEILDCLQSGAVIADKNAKTSVSYATWLSTASINQLSALANYIKVNGCSDETSAFTLLAIDAYDNGGEVDTVNNVILDSTFVNNPKAKCVYQKLKEAGGIKDILKDYFDTTQTANLVLKLEPNLICSGSGTPFGCASFDGNTQAATITLDEGFITQFQWQTPGGVYQTPLLNVARVILHEAIHAQLSYFKYQVTNGNPISDLTFEELYEDYRVRKGWQHQFMANHHLGTIAEALEEVHPLLNDQSYIDYINNNFSAWSWPQIYKNMAWSGLTQTPIGQTYLSDPTNNTLYSLQNTNVAVNSNETHNCD